MKTGNTLSPEQKRALLVRPQWSPVMKTGNTLDEARDAWENSPASMEPGHEDREYKITSCASGAARCRLNGARS